MVENGEDEMMFCHNHVKTTFESEFQKEKENEPGILFQRQDDVCTRYINIGLLCKQEAQLLLGDRATRKHAKDS